VSGFWFGLITPDNLSDAVKCYYAERGGRFLIAHRPEVVLSEVENLYETWDEEKTSDRTRVLRETMLPEFSPELAAKDWESLLARVL
jgi:hypothetical protein